MEEAIEVLSRYKFLARIDVDRYRAIEQAIKILSLHNRTQEVQLPRELHSEGLNGLINSLESMRASGISRVEIVDCEDGSLKIKELK